MKRFTSLIIIVVIIAGMNTIPIFASPGSPHISSWVLSDSEDNLWVEMIQYPKITMAKNSFNDNQPVEVTELHEIVLKTDIASAQKYIEYFKNSHHIPELVLYGINTNRIPRFKITLGNCMVSGITVTELPSFSLSAHVKAIIKIKAGEIKTERLSPSGARIEADPVKMLDTAKIYLNDVECAGNASFSGIEGFAAAYGKVEYIDSELLINSEEIGTLPDWLACFDGENDYTAGANPDCKLRYELFERTSDDKLSISVDLYAIQQELIEASGDKVIYKYTFRVSDLIFDAPSAAVSSTPAPPDKFVPAAPRVQEHTWEGKWMTTFGDMALKQSEKGITGEYGNTFGMLEGTASGNKLSGIWQDILSSGTFEFIMSDDGNSFSGTMYDQAMGKRGSLQWNGERE